MGAGADIYSLGLVLRELLTGQMPDLPQKGLPAARAMNDLLDRRPQFDTSVRKFNPAIPPSLEAIVAKCLALDPADRYADADSLARDLERFLNHQPLLEAGNPSLRERLTNYWMRQRRRVSRAGYVAAGILAVMAGLAYPAREWLSPREPSSVPEFQSAVAAVERGNTREAAETFKRVVKDFPRSCLARFYLAFSTDDTRQGDFDAKRVSQRGLGGRRR